MGLLEPTSKVGLSAPCRKRRNSRRVSKERKESKRAKRKRSAKRERESAAETRGEEPKWAGRQYLSFEKSDSIP